MLFNLKCISVLLALGISITARPAPSSHIVHEKRQSLHSRWEKRDRVDQNALLPMRIALTQSNLDDAHKHLMDVSDPASPNYGKHWTPEQVVEAFKPSEDTVSAVSDWLAGAGISLDRITHSDNKGWFAFHATAGEAEDLLMTEYHEYEDLDTGGIMPACDKYHLPKHLQEHIDYVTPGVKLLAPVETAFGKRDESARSRNRQPLRKWPAWPGPFNSTDLSMCDVAITPACVAALYQIPPTHGRPVAGNSMGIFESELQYWAQEDLDSFFTNFTSYIPNGTHPIDINIDGGVAMTTNLSAAGGEAELDLMLAYPIIYPQTITLYNVDDLLWQADPNITYTYGFNTFLDALDGSYCTSCAYGECGDAAEIGSEGHGDPVYPDPRPGGYKGNLQCGLYKPTNVISLSYGGQEADVPVYYQKRQCNEYLKLGLQGVSIMFASGDSGVSNYPAPYGFDGPTGCLGKDLNIFNPTWPNTCPYVTNVGATKVYPGKTVFEPESAVYDPAGAPYAVNFSSGGGFSNVYPIPDYQASAVATFFNDHNPPYPYYSGLVTDLQQVGIGNLGANGGIYNRIGRGVPDVAANGDNIAVYVGGEYELSGGTSASTPIFSAVINRINEERLRCGKSTLGFLNPSLYANPSMLNDITNGTNPGCNTPGFSAVEGWDPVTGLGTPNYPKMLKYYLELP